MSNAPNGNMIDEVFWNKVKKVVVGALIAGAGAALTYLIGYLGQFDLGLWGPAAGALLSSLVNALRKLGEYVNEKGV